MSPTGRPTDGAPRAESWGDERMLLLFDYDGVVADSLTAFHGAIGEL